MMADWLGYLRRVTARVRQDDLDDVESGIVPPIPEPAPPHAPTWHDTILGGLPLGMLISGLLITACSQLIGVWAILGYLLLVASPIVYQLNRIEKRLVETLHWRKEESRRRGH